MTQLLPFLLTMLAAGFTARVGTPLSALLMPTINPRLSNRQVDEVAPADDSLECTSDDQCPDFTPYCLDGSCSYYEVSCTYDPVVCKIGHHGGLCVCGDGSTVAWGEELNHESSSAEMLTQCELSAQHYCSSAFPREACEGDSDCSDTLPYCESGGCQPNLSCTNPAGTCVATRYGARCDCITGTVVVANNDSDANFPPRTDMQAACVANLEEVCGTEPPPLPLSCIDDALAICTAYAEKKIAFDRACTGDAGNNQPFANLYECCVNEYWADEIDHAALDCITELNASTCSEWLHGWWSCTSGGDDDGGDDSVTDAGDTDQSSGSEGDSATDNGVTELDTDVTDDETTDETTGTQGSTGTDSEDDHDEGSDDDLEEWLVSCEAHGGDGHGCTLGGISTPWIAGLAAIACARRRRTRR